MSQNTVITQLVRQLNQNPADAANDAAEMLMAQEMIIAKLKYTMRQIADGSDPLTVIRSLARQALNRK